MRIAMTAVFAATALLSTPAMAEVERFTLAIPYGDIDLSSADGMAELETRIETLVEDACTDPQLAQRGEGPDMKCVERTREAALAQLSSVLEARSLALR